MPECLAGDLKLELDGRELYVEAIAYCESVKDYVSREILDGILEDTEEHIDYLETQIGLVVQLGLQNYLQSAMGEMGFFSQWPWKYMKCSEGWLPPLKRGNEGDLRRLPWYSGNGQAG